MGLRARALLGTAALVLATPAAATAAQQQAYAVGLNYATPAIVVNQGDTLKFNNIDVTAHTLSSNTPGLFDSGVVSGGNSTVVTGVDKLAPGTYQFFCSFHPWMHGAIQVVAPGTVPSPPSPPPLPDPNNPPNPVDLLPRAAPAALTGGDWPFYGKDLANSRDGGSAGPSVTQAPFLKPVWSFKSTQGDFTGTPVESGGTVVGLSGFGSVYALDASTGKLLWQRDLGQQANATPAIADGTVFVPLAIPSGPEVVALSLADGSTRWTTVTDSQNGADAYGSPVVWNGKVYIGISGENGDPALPLRGAVVALDETTGAVDWKTYTVPPGFNGAPVWSTPAIDTATGHLFVGTGNAYIPPAASTTDAIMELDANAGTVLNSWQATAGDVFSPNSVTGPDADFGASPNLLSTSTGRALVGEGQKSGTYWALDRSTLAPVWSQTVGPGSAVGGVIGSTAYDGSRVYGPVTPAGEAWALTRDGGVSWASADGGPLHFSPTSVANGVVYTADDSGVLTLREAATGAVLDKVPLAGMTYGGVSIAGGYVFVAVGTQSPSGYLVAYRADPPAAAGG
jgi:polyvinyl alcohol dehydrogenase (cytochrome)